MGATSFDRFEDERIVFEYPGGFEVTASSDPGRFHYMIARPGNLPMPGAVIDMMLEESQARAVETMLRKFNPLETSTMRQVVQRRGTVATSHFQGLEVLTTTEQVPSGPRRTSEWTVFMDFGFVWIHFAYLCEGDLDQAIWSHVLQSIRVLTR